MKTGDHFEQSLDRLIAPLYDLFSEGRTTVNATRAPSEESKGRGDFDPSELLSLLREDDQKATEWLCQMDCALENGRESVRAITLVQMAVDSLFESLQSVDFTGTSHSPEVVGTITSGVGSHTSMPKDNMHVLTTLVTELERIFKDLEDPELAVSSTRFAKLVEELLGSSKSLKILSVPTAVKREYYPKVFSVFEKLHQTLRDAIANSIVDSASTIVSSASIEEATAKLRTLQLETREEAEGVLSPSTKGARSPLEVWREAFSLVSEPFFLKMEDCAPMRRLLEMIESSMNDFADSPDAAAVSERALEALFETYIRTRVRLLTSMLRWWVKDTGSVAVSAESLTAGIKISPLTPHVPSAEEGPHPFGTLPSLVEVMAIALEAFTEMEKSLVERIWMRNEFALSILPQIFFTVSEDAYSLFRSYLLCVDDVTELSKTVERAETVRLFSSKRQWVKFAELWVRVTQDTQERLIFRSSIYLKQRVASVSPTAEWGKKYLALATVDRQSPIPSITESEGEKVEPPLEYLPSFPLTIDLLTSLHRTLSSGIFSALAEEAIRLCLTHLSQLKQIMRSLKPTDETMVLLTEMGHLYFLHHHLSSLDANMTVTEKKLDLRQSLRYRKIKIVESSRESMQSVENEFATCYQKLVDRMTSTMVDIGKACPAKDETSREETRNEMKKRTSTFEHLLLVFVPDQWLRAKILLPVYQVVEASKT